MPTPLQDRIEALLSVAPMTVQTLAQQVDRSPRVVRTALRKMVRDGRASREGFSKGGGWHARPGQMFHVTHKEKA
jgi:predicted ArsR family transcriptional regulator